MKKILTLFVIWRSYLFLLAALSPLIIPTFGAKFPYFNERLVATNLPHFIWSFGNFDGVHYLGISQNGYSAQFTQAFFPVYPVVIKLVSTPLQILIPTPASNLISALLISNTFFLLLMIFLYKLVQQVFNENTAIWTLIFLVSFPTSFFFGALYTESLFLFLIILAYYLVEKDKIIEASLLGSVSSATRLIGVFLAPTIKFSKDKNIIAAWLVIPVGLLFYMLYLYLSFKDPLYFIHAQTAFGNERSTTQIVLLPQVIFRYLKIFMSTSGPLLFQSLFELISTLLAYFLLGLCFYKKKIKKEWLFFSLAAITAPTLTGTLTSMPRYILVAFPIFIYLGQIKNTYLKILIALIFVALLSITTVIFTQGYWVA